MIPWLGSLHRLHSGDQLFFLIGSDAFDEIETWHDWRELVKLTDFIVVARPGHEYRTPPGTRVHKLDGLALPVSEFRNSKPACSARAYA